MKLIITESKNVEESKENSIKHFVEFATKRLKLKENQTRFFLNF